MIGSLTDLARRQDMPSLPTLRRMITLHPDFPIVSRGSHGVAYLIDLDTAAAFVRALAEGRATRPVTRRQAILALGEDLLGQFADDAHG